MYHILCLFLLDNVPALLRKIFKGGAESGMILLPPHALEFGIGIRYRCQLKFRWLDAKDLSDRHNTSDYNIVSHASKGVLRENLGCLGLFIRVLLPFNVPVPSFFFFGKVCLRMA